MSPESLDTYRMVLSTTIPTELATDPEFALASLLAVDARIQAWGRYGHGIGLWLLATRITATVADGQLDDVLVIETDWAVTIPVAAA